MGATGTINLGVNRGVTVSGDSVLDVTAGNLTVSGILTGSKNLEKTGAGALTLAGVNTLFNGLLNTITQNFCGRYLIILIALT